MTELRIATMSVATLNGRVASTKELMQTRNIVLVLQETRVSDVSLPGIQRAFKADHLQYHGSPESRQRQGGEVRGGVAIVSRWPASKIRLPTSIDPLRAVAVDLHRPGERPVVLIGCYIHASRKFMNEKRVLVKEITEYTNQISDQVIVAGDWNMQKTDMPIAEYLANGTYRDLDEDFVGGATTTYTRQSGRCIDYAIARRGMYASDRTAVFGLADHMCVCYTFELLGPLATPNVWRKKRHLVPVSEERSERSHTETMVEEKFNDVWSQKAHTFETAKNANDHAAACHILSGCAEYALAAEPHQGGHDTGKPRAEVPTTHKRSPASTRPLDAQSLTERRLRRLERRLRQWHASHVDPRPALKSANIRGIRTLAGAFPILNIYEWDDTAILKQVETLIDAEAESSNQKRVDKWKEDMTNSYASRRKWVMRAPDETFTSGDPHPSLRAKAFRQKLEKLWDTDVEQYERKWPVEVDQWIENNKCDAPDPVIDAERRHEADRKAELAQSCGSGRLEPWPPRPAPSQVVGGGGCAVE